MQPIRLYCIARAPSFSWDHFTPFVFYHNEKTDYLCEKESNCICNYTIIYNYIQSIHLYEDRVAIISPVFFKN
jgi:hypothetical protein